MTSVDSATSVSAIRLTAEAFALYGQVIEAAGDGGRFGPDDAQLELHRGTPRFSIMRLEDRPPEFHTITRHRSVTQCLAAVGGGTWWLAVAPPDAVDDPDARPDLARLAAFTIPGDVAVKLHRGTWHSGPYFEAPEMSFFNLELSDTNEVDHHTVDVGPHRIA